MPNIPTELENAGQTAHPGIPPTDNLHPISSENQTEQDFHIMDAWIVYQLVNQKVIRAKPSENGKNYVVDFQKATEVLQDCYPQPEPGEAQASQPNDELATRSQTALKRSIKAFVDHGILTPFFVLQVGNITRPSNIQTGGGHGYVARFLENKNISPADPNERASIQIGHEFGVISEMKQLQKAARECGLEFTGEELADLALRSTVSHEYGHAIASTLIQHQAYMIAPRRSNLTPQQIFQEVEASFYGAICTSIAPNTELVSILENEPPNGTYTARYLPSVERFAQGFQYLGLRFALESMGLDPSKAETIVTKYSKQNKKRLKDWIKIYELLQSHGLTLEDVSKAIADIQQNLEEKKLDTLNYQFDPYVSAASLGYFFPLDRAQLTATIDQAWSGSIWRLKAV